MSAMSRYLSAKRTTAAADLPANLAALPEMAAVDLRAEWRRLYRAHPPKRVARAFDRSSLRQLGISS